MIALMPGGTAATSTTNAWQCGTASGSLYNLTRLKTAQLLLPPQRHWRPPGGSHDYLSTSAMLTELAASKR
jgi:hypothetical protein